MKLQFTPDLEYQRQAVAAVVDLFRGQTPMQSNFTVTAWDAQAGMFENGIGNRLEIGGDRILANLRAVQLRGGLPPSPRLEEGSDQFDVEMETGTGKTYVYLRTILELNKNYGFTKFIIVVPSIAIKEGVYKSLQITREHFRGLYDNRVYEYFIYDSGSLEQVRAFAVSDHTQIMIINIDAFRRSFDDPEKETKANIIHRVNDRMNGQKPIELIAETRPFVIIDEPQSVDNTPKARDAIRSLNPLCCLRYSATHVQKHHPVYRLDAVSAYELRLVKQIEVAGFESQNAFNAAYMKLLSVNNAKSPITARIEMDVYRNRTPVRKAVTVKAGDDLYDKSGGRDVYDGYIVNEIYCGKGREYVDFTGKPDVLELGKAVGGVDELAVKRQQIRKTIEEHLGKELSLNRQGVKVLSLFFIDRVANYRAYDDHGNPVRGKYALMFEEEYRDLIRRPKYRELLGDTDPETAARQAHDGYFSQDRKGVLKDTRGDTEADDGTYALIMRDKERLLSFDSRLRFIFSHSALREGWDNPNVFQICTLNETRSEIKKRQEIGRGLRLCVNQEGQRVHGFEVNTLTVMANESYDSFARALQSEYETEEGIRFGVLETHSFANIPVAGPDGSAACLGQPSSEEIYHYYLDKGYIDAGGKIQDKLKIALVNRNAPVPAAYAALRQEIIWVLSRASRNLPIRNNADKKKVEVNKEVFLGDDFRALWDRIKYKTTYDVRYDSETLTSRCCERMKELHIETAKLVYTKAGMDIGAGGVGAVERERQAVMAADAGRVLPDILSFLQNETNLTRRTLADILRRSGTLEQFKRNPQKYMDEVCAVIRHEMRRMIVDGIRYTRIGGDEFYAQELFDNKDLFGYLSKNMLKSKRSVYEYVVYDSDNEADFARKFENNRRVLVYAKLPHWFQIATPLGSYNPDWAVLVEKDGEQKLYFVLETKKDLSNLRPAEDAKIKCGMAHFEALGSGAVFEAVDDFEQFMEKQ